MEISDRIIYGRFLDSRKTGELLAFIVIKENELIVTDDSIDIRSYFFVSKHFSFFSKWYVHKDGLQWRIKNKYNKRFKLIHNELKNKVTFL